MTNAPSAPSAVQATNATNATATKPIIVGVDGSASSLEALTWAVRQARLLGTRVHAVIAWQYPAVYGMYAMSDSVSWADNAKLTIDAAVKEALGDDTDDVTPIVVEGYPAQVLIDRSADAELLVVGNRGHGGLAGALLGSVSEKAVAHASCPVVVVRSQPAHHAASGTSSETHP